MSGNDGQDHAEPKRQGAFAPLDLRLLATSDLHANILAWDYHANRVSDQVGLARVAQLIRAARAEQPQSLLFDNGDFLHGTELGDYLAETTPVIRSGRPLRTHPMIAAMNALKYDAVSLGNHEFGHGLGFLRRSLAATQFPIVCSNLYFRPTRGKPLALPYLLLDRVFSDRAGVPHQLKIGVLGLIPPQTMLWEYRYLKSRASVADIVASVRDLVPQLKVLGADIIVALSHSGIGQTGPQGGAENASAGVAEVAGVDAVVAGHTHLVFPTPDRSNIAGKPVVMPGFHGSHLGVIDLRLEHKPDGWRVAGFSAETRPISKRCPKTGLVEPLVADDPKIAAFAQNAHKALLARVQTVIGETAIPLHSYFSLVSDTPALRLVARAQASHAARALAETPQASLPLLSVAAPFKAGGRGGPENYTAVAAGPLCSRHVSDLYIHPNSICVLRLTGADLAAWLERSVSIYYQIAQGDRDAELLDPSFPSFNFDVIDGLSFVVDLSQPARFDTFGNIVNPTAQRIADLRYLGQPLRPEQIFLLATNSYRAAGGVGFSGAAPENVIYEAPKGNREVLADFLRAGGRPRPQDVQPQWSFAPLPGTSVVFQSSPQAVAHLGEVPHLRIEPLGVFEDGFQRFRLWL